MKTEKIIIIAVYTIVAALILGTLAGFSAAGQEKEGKTPSTFQEGFVQGVFFGAALGFLVGLVDANDDERLQKRVNSFLGMFKRKPKRRTLQEQIDYWGSHPPTQSTKGSKSTVTAQEAR